MTIHRAIQAYYDDAVGEHHRYRSWEHCYAYFRRTRPLGLDADREHASLQLAFYLASWGMYRGSSFLLQHAYTIHRGVIELIAGVRFDELWDADLGAKATHGEFMPLLRELSSGIRETYQPFVPTLGSAQPTDTLITKILLGTFGCLPACDRYFIDGLQSEGIPYSSLNDRFVARMIDFCQANLSELQEQQASIEQSSGIRYPLMKLVDMYFWQVGYEKENPPGNRDENGH